MPTLNAYGIPGPTDPKDAYVAGRTSVPSAGGYKGYNITPGSDAEIAAQVQRINSLGVGTTPAAPPPTAIGTGTGVGGTTGAGTGVGGTTGTGTDLDTAYSNAMSKYLESLTSSNEIAGQVDKAALGSRHAIEDIYDRPGGLKSGAIESAAYFTRRANANLADLGIAQDASTRATQAALERVKFEKDRLGKTPEDFNLSPGQTRYTYDPATGSYKEVASIASKEPAGPASVQEYEYAVSQGYKGSFSDYQNEDANRKARATGTGGTLAERLASSYAKIDSLLQPGRRIDDGVPVLDARGYLTKVGFDRIMAAAREEGITRKNFLAEYANFLFPGDAGDYAAYGITGAEAKAIRGY